VSLFVWRLLRNRLPTRDNLVRRNILQPPVSLCPFGCNVLESARHIFLECAASNYLWCQVTSWLGIYVVFPIELRDHLYQFSHMAGLPRYTHSFLTGIWFACVWIIWKVRNERIFKNAHSHPYALVEKAKLHSFLWVKAKHPSFTYCYYDWWKHPMLCLGVH